MHGGGHLRRTTPVRMRVQLVHAMLVAMLRGDTNLILGSCSVRAKCGGELTGPNPTDRAKSGTKYHVAETGAAFLSPARPLRPGQRHRPIRAPVSAFVMARIGTVFAYCSYDAESNRALYRGFGAEPCIYKRRQPSGSSLGQKHWPVECSNA